MKNFKITSSLECLGTDPDDSNYNLYSFTVKAEIDGKAYEAEPTEWAVNKWRDMAISDCPRYAYIGDCGSEYEICTYWTDNYSLENRWIKSSLDMFYQGNAFSENVYIIEIATNKIVAEYHDSENSRSIIIHDKEICYLA